MDKPKLVSALESQFKIEKGYLVPFKSIGYKLPEVKETKETKKINTIKSKLHKLIDKTEKIYENMIEYDEFLDNNKLDNKAK